MTEHAPTEEELERGRVLFAASCVFVRGITAPEHFLPPGLPEIAFAGRSNVGKSSLINALTGRKNLARASKTPGRTQQINFFDLGERLFLVDLPGYGFAKAAKTDAQSWNDLVLHYLQNRSVLRTVCLLIDSRHGFKESDISTMGFFDRLGVPCHIVLTKTDKLKESQKLQIEEEAATVLKNHVSAFPKVFMVSSQKGTGIAALRGRLGNYAIEN